MSTTTQRLGLFKYDTVADSAVPFNIDDALNYNWDILEQKVGPNRNVGEIIASTLPLTDAGLHLLDGALILGDGIYSEFVEYIAQLYTDNPDANYFTDETTWQNSIQQYGVCGKFVYDSLANTVRLPKITGILEGTTDLSALGDLVEAGLPIMTTNGAGSHSHSITAECWRGADGNNKAARWCGADRKTGSATGYTSTVGDHTHTINTGVGESNTVQPQTIKAFYYIVIATSTKTDIEVDIDEITTDLNGKVDTDLTNMSASQSAKNEIIGWGMPDFSSRITIPYNTSIQLPCDAVVYHQDYSDTYEAYCFTEISLDGTNWIIIGEWGWTCMGSSYTVLPKGIFVRCGGKNSTNYTAWYAPLKGTSNDNTSGSGTSQGGTDIALPDEPDDPGFINAD